MPIARSIHGTRLHYAERGEPRPEHLPALLIHGAGASSAVWAMVLARLGRHTRAVAIDLPGHGPSPLAADDGPALLRYRDAVGELAAALCLGPSVLVGHSLGALVAIEAALAWPEKVRGLLLCAAAPRFQIPRELLRAIAEDDGRLPELLAEKSLSPAAPASLRRGFVAAGVAAPREVTLADFTAGASADLTDRLALVRCPMVWLDGADDLFIADAAATAERPGRTRRLADVGHVVPIEAPAVVAEEAVALCFSGSAPP